MNDDHIDSFSFCCKMQVAVAWYCTSSHSPSNTCQLLHFYVCTSVFLFDISHTHRLISRCSHTSIFLIGHHAHAHTHTHRMMTEAQLEELLNWSK